MSKFARSPIESTRAMAQRLANGPNAREWTPLTKPVLGCVKGVLGPRSLLARRPSSSLALGKASLARRRREVDKTKL